MKKTFLLSLLLTGSMGTPSVSYGMEAQQELIDTRSSGANLQSMHQKLVEDIQQLIHGDQEEATKINAIHQLITERNDLSLCFSAHENLHPSFIEDDVEGNTITVSPDVLQQLVDSASKT